MTETTIAFTELLGRRVRMGTWEDQKISTYRKILEALDEGRWDDAAELESYFIDEAIVCFAIYRQWIPDVRNYLLSHGRRPGHRRRPQRAGDRGRAAARRLARGSRARQWDRLPDRDAGRHGGHLPRAAGRGQGAAGRRQGDLAPVPRPRRRPHLRPDVAGQGAAGRAGHPRHVRRGAAAAVRVALREVRHRQASLGRGARDADARRLRGDARPPRRPRADRRHGADRDRGPLHPPLRPVRLRPADDPRATGSRARPPRMEAPYDWTVVEEPAHLDPLQDRASASTASTASC